MPLAQKVTNYLTVHMPIVQSYTSIEGNFELSCNNVLFVLTYVSYFTKGPYGTGTIQFLLKWDKNFSTVRK